MLTGTIYFVTYAYISFLLAYTLKRLVAGVTNAASADKSSTSNIKMRTLVVDEIKRGFKLVASMFFLAWLVPGRAVR